MWNLIKKDYLLILANKMEVYFFIIAIPIIISFGFLDNRWIFILIVSTVYLLSFNGFYNSNQDDDSLVYSLPLKKYTVVASKYIMLFLNHIVITSYVFGVTWILLKMNLISEIQYMSLVFFKLTLLFSIIILSLGLPLFFSYKPRISMTAINILIALFTSFSFQKLFYEGDLYNPAIDRVKLVNSPRFILGVLMAMIISMIISLYGYKKKEF